MGTKLDRCDFLDVLEEAAVLRRPVVVELREGTVFEDRVRDVVTEQGEDFAVFVDHARVPVSDIADCRRATPAA
jgi:Rho-binding antiterminator